MTGCMTGKGKRLQPHCDSVKQLASCFGLVQLTSGNKFFFDDGGNDDDVPGPRLLQAVEEIEVPNPQPCMGSTEVIVFAML